MKERLEEEMKKGRRVKIIFQYPNTSSAKVRRGIIKRVGRYSFDIQEVRDGLTTYSYDYICEVKIDG